MGSLFARQWLGLRRSSRRLQPYRHARPAPRRLGFELLEPRLAPANWSGDIPDGTIWDNTQVQAITGNAHVPAGATLTIQAGTVIQFNGGTNLTVDGRLDAPGTAAAPVTFTSYRDASPLGGADGGFPGDWGAVKFEARSSGTLNHVAIRYGGHSGAYLPGELILAAGVPVSGSTVSKSVTAGVRVTGSSPALGDDTFTANGGAALSLDMAAQPAVTAPAVRGNGTDAAVLDGGPVSGTVT